MIAACLENSPWTKIDKGPHKSNIELSFGTRTQVKNLPNWQVNDFAKMTIVAAIRRYINHRKIIIHKHGGRNTEETRHALQKLDYAFGGSVCRWKIEDLPRIIRNYSTFLMAVAPGQKSKYYRSHSQLLFDLLNWARHALIKNHNRHG